MPHHTSVTPVRLETLSPYHYQSLAIPSGVSSLSTHMADRSVSYGLAAALGGMSASAALPEKDYRRDFASMTWLASVFEADAVRLMRPRGRRLTLDHEGGYTKGIQDATGTGNLKTWFYIQEIPPGVVYDGAVFGIDPFAVAGEAEGREVDEIVFRIGRHRGGLVRMTRGDATHVRLNLHTGFICDCDVANDPDLQVDLPILWDLQVSQPLTLAEAASKAEAWMESVKRAAV